MLGGYVIDLEVGDVFEAMNYVLTPEMVREYCLAVEVDPNTYRINGDESALIVPPTMIHADKVRFLHEQCPKTQRGVDVMEDGRSTSRLHYEFDADFHDVVKVGEEVNVTGQVTARYEKRGRPYLELDVAWRRKTDGKLLIQYRDTCVLSFESKA